MRIALTSFAFVVLGIALLSGAGLAPSQQSSSPTPLQLFQRLLPVIRHPRCSNCHGGVDPFTGRNHPPGRETADDCKDCHSDVKDWTIPSPDHFFVGKSDRQVCGLFSDFASKQGHKLFISNHLRGDALIVAAFAGMAGGARDPDPPEKPPIEQEPFINLAQDWLDRGFAACDIEGTITHEESVHSEDVWHIDPQSDDSVVQDATRTVTVTRSGNGFQAHIEINGSTLGTHIQHRQDAHGQPCTVTTKLSTRWSGSASGPANVEANYLVIYGDTNPALGQRDYRIDVTLPPEHTTRTSSGSINNQCGALLPPVTPDTQEFDWDQSKITFEGHLDDNSQANLVGACDRMVKHGDVGITKGVLEMPCNRFGNIGNAETPAIMNDADIAFHDGSDIRFRVQSFWNIRPTK
jgi:hypothetical protein